MAIRVFMVEDFRRTQELIRDTLDFVGGFELVGSASDETAAIEWLQAHPGEWDLAILDLLLQHGSGFTLIPRCRRAGGSVVVFSDFLTPAVKERCLSLGAEGVVSKASFRDLRVFLEDFRGRVEETAVTA